MDRVDADLSQEEQSYVRHYLGYADALIRSVEENASPETRNVGAPESSAPSSAASADERSKQQQPAEQPATKDDPVRAA
jgi:hypothetical protein